MKVRFLLLCILGFAVLGGLSALADDKPIKGEVCKASCDHPCGWRDCAKKCDDDLSSCKKCCNQGPWSGPVFDKCMKRCKEILPDPCAQED